MLKIAKIIKPGHKIFLNQEINPTMVAQKHYNSPSEVNIRHVHNFPESPEIITDIKKSQSTDDDYYSANGSN